MAKNTRRGKPASEILKELAETIKSCGLSLDQALLLLKLVAAHEANDRKTLDELLERALEEPDNKTLNAYSVYSIILYGLVTKDEKDI
jgi:hypothetical protein